MTNIDYNDYIKVLKKYLARNDLKLEERNFLLRYIVMNKNIKQTSYSNLNDYQKCFLEDLANTKIYLKKSNQLTSEYLEELLAIYDKLLELLISNLDSKKNKINSQEFIELYYSLEKLKTKCNINSSHADIVIMGIEDKYYVRKR